METKRRHRLHFVTYREAEAFADLMNRSGEGEDVTITPDINREDKARGCDPRSSGAFVCWTEWSTD